MRPGAGVLKSFRARLQTSQGNPKAAFKRDRPGRGILGSSAKGDHTMTRHSDIRRRPDGSIDTAHYMAQGRRRRSEAARHLAGEVPRSARRPLFGLAALIALLPFPGGQG